MSAFAGFVQGVFQGMDWREARDERARQRKMDKKRWDWEKEDRDWQRTDRQESRARAASAQSEAASQQAEAEARAERIQQSLDQAMRGTSPREMSAAPGVSTQGQSAPEAPAPRTPQRGALSVMGLGELGTSATGRSMGQDAPQGSARAAQPSLSMGEPVPQQQAAAQPQDAPRPAPRGDAQPDPADVARGAQIAGVSPYVPGEDRTAAPQQVAEATPPPPPSQRGFSLDSLIASPAQASTLPDDPQRRGPAPSTARQDAVQGRGQGFSDYTEATRGFRSDAPRRGTEAEMVERAKSAQRPERPASSAEAQERADRVRQITSSLAPQSDPVSNVMDSLTQRGMGVAGAFSDAAGVVQSAAGATNAGARSFDRAEGMRDAQQRLEQQQQERRERPARAEQPASAQGRADTRPSDRTPEQRAEQRERAAGSYAFNLGGAEMNLSNARRVLSGTVADTAAEIAGRFGAGTGSIEAAGEEMKSRPSMSATDAMKGDQPRQSEVRAYSKRAASRFQREQVERHARVLESEGMIQEAQAWREYAQSENTRKAMEKLSETMYYWNMNDEARALQSVVELYNMNGYYDDGLSALSEGTAFQYNEQGAITGLTVTFRDEATGNVFQQTINGPRDKVMALVVGGLSPEATFEAALEAVGGIGGPQQGHQIPELSHSDWRGYRNQARDAIRDERGLDVDAPIDQAEVDQRARQMAANLPDARSLRPGQGQETPLMH